jgi:hypothetical protein
VFRLDYVSCSLTVLSTVLVGRRQWTGLLVGSVNSLLICAIGWRTAQFGFIPANLFCIGIYGFSIRSWLKKPAHLAANANLEAAGEPAPALASDGVVAPADSWQTLQHIVRFRISFAGRSESAARESNSSR